MSCRLCVILVFLIWLTTATAINAEDGYRLWLRYDALPSAQITAYRAQIKSLIITGNWCLFSKWTENNAKEFSVKQPFNDFHFSSL